MADFTENCVHHGNLTSPVAFDLFMSLLVCRRGGSPLELYVLQLHKGAAFASPFTFPATGTRHT
jgi:hypothetical protein